MGTAVVLVVMAVVAFFVARRVWTHRSSLVPRRGMGVAADFGVLGATPRVHIESITRTGADTARLVVRREGSDNPEELTFVVALQEGEFGAGLLEEWRQADSSIAMVIPPNTHILRLRSVDSLQNLTLRRVEVE